MDNKEFTTALHYLQAFIDQHEEDLTHVLGGKPTVNSIATQYYLMGDSFVDMLENVASLNYAEGKLFHAEGKFFDNLKNVLDVVKSAVGIAKDSKAPAAVSPSPVTSGASGLNEALLFQQQLNLLQQQGAAKEGMSPETRNILIGGGCFAVFIIIVVLLFNSRQA